jgi:predicted kinase
VQSGFIEPWKPESHDQNKLVYEIVAAAAGSYASAGYFTIVEGIVIPRWFLGPLSSALRDAGHEVAYAVLRAPLAVCLERASARDEAVDEAVVEQLWNAFADRGDLEPHAIEVADISAEEAADLVLARLGAGELTL